MTALKQFLIAADTSPSQVPSRPCKRKCSGTIQSHNLWGAATESGELRLQTATITQRTRGEREREIEPRTVERPTDRLVKWTTARGVRNQEMISWTDPPSPPLHEPIVDRGTYQLINHDRNIRRLKDFVAHLRSTPTITVKLISCSLQFYYTLVNVSRSDH